MARIEVAALLAGFALAGAGCVADPPPAPPAPPKLSDAVRESADAYTRHGFPRPAAEAVSIEDVTLPLENGYVLKVFDVRQLTEPLADFRGPDIGLHPPNPFYYGTNRRHLRYGDPYYGIDGTYGEPEAFEPYYGIGGNLFLFLDPSQDLYPYLREGLEYDESPYTKRRDERRAQLVERVTASTGGDSWSTDPNVGIGYYSGLLVVRQREEVMREVEFLIALLRAQPGG